MLKAGNIIPNFTVVLVLFIIIVSTIPTYIKLILALFTISFLIPIGRKVIFQHRLRKMKVALYTSLVFSLGITVVAILNASIPFNSSDVTGFLLVFFFSSIGIFCYGIPVSIIAELVSKRYPNYRALVSGVIHIGLGLFTVTFSLFEYLHSSVFIWPTICSIIFFLIDEITRTRLRDGHSKINI
ncbi:hypothetical protein [Guptibacillus hwajinpoensis]|uniref:Major facilitator superfamily (MFS) profile domain-containing protein n=1 Tax=Guptibacillus hwajinpoensis TaxID=208199 RepID=A0ABU0K5S2_9BACL|nr:hypothetical protein [Alkalihalobacillus hemicentroti]MDQ0483713.1 hypothetical protein [Alkalihalobacillus hemicentroti]